MRKPIYLDFNATTPPAPEVMAAVRPFLEEHFGNPSSAHAYGRTTRDAVDRARTQVATLLDVKSEEIVFTSAGTENVLEIVGLGAACAMARRDGDRTRTHLKTVTDSLWENLHAAIPDIRLNGHPTERLPNTLNVSFRDLDGHHLLEAIDQDVAASAGSACHSGGVSISPVLNAMNIPAEWAAGAIRLSTGKTTTREEIAVAAETIARAVKSPRKSTGRGPFPHDSPSGEQAL